jgi:hypothetical protein
MEFSPSYYRDESAPGVGKGGIEVDNNGRFFGLVTKKAHGKDRNSLGSRKKQVSFK